MCCDLLSFYYLCRTGNNFVYMLGLSILLWFAFILLSLSYWKQRLWSIKGLSYGCDLLSFYYLCRTGNNLSAWPYRMVLVVICFHFTIFVVLETTKDAKTTSQGALWFAFILLSLSYWKQLLNPAPFVPFSCDLLSFYYLCRTGNNTYKKMYSAKTVVICFHFTIFVVLETTNS